MLYHFSEEGDIREFVPRERQNRAGFPPVVWAIDDQHAFTYYFPRACPRIVVNRKQGVSEVDRLAFFGHTTARSVVTIESGWLPRLRDCTLYRYSFEEDGFELQDAGAGYYVTSRTVRPAEVTKLTNLIDLLLEQGVELRLTPNLYPLRNAILASSFDQFGIHRFANAIPLVPGQDATGTCE